MSYCLLVYGIVPSISPKHMDDRGSITKKIRIKL